MQAVAEGDPVKAARFEFVRPGDGGKWVTAATFEFTDGFATSYQAGSGGEPVESVSMEFRPTK
jgi:type VI protein secretion system component Hcp